MADGKKIEIRIAATGADQAAAEIKKVEQASEAAASRGFGGQLDGTTPRDEEHEKRIAQIEAETAAIVAQEKEMADSVAAEIAGMKEKEAAAAKYAETLRDVSTKDKTDHTGFLSRKQEIVGAVGAIGVAAGLAGKTMAHVYDKLREINTADLAGVDAALAKNIDSMRALAEAAQDPIGALAKFASGGVGIDEAFDGLADQIKRNAEMRAAEIDRILARGIVQVDEIKRLADELKAANELLAARDKTASLRDKAAGAEAIRNGADPNDVAADLAAKEADREKARIAREIDANNAPVQTAFDNAKQARANIEKVIQDAKKKADELEARIAEAQKNDPVSFTSDGQQDGGFSAQKLIDQRGETSGVFRLKIGEAQAAAKQAQEEAERIKREADAKNALLREQSEQASIQARMAAAAAEDRKKEAARREAVKEAQGYGKEFFDGLDDGDREAKRQARERLDAGEAGLDRSARESGLKMRGSSNKNSTLQAVGKALSDGTDERELQKLGDMVLEAQEKNGALLTGLMMKVLNGLAAQAKITADLKSRIDRMP